MFEHDKELLKEVKEQVRELKDIRNLLNELVHPSKMEIHFRNGDINTMSSTSVTLVPPQTAAAVATEVYKGVPYTPVPTDLTWSLQDPTIASFVTNADGSATFTPLKAGVTQVGCSDKTTSLSGVGTLTVTGGGGSGDSLTITFTPSAASLAARRL
jgi:hypothetical protein